MIKFCCKNCGQKISVPEVHAGKKGKCPKCKTILLVPPASKINADIPLKLQDSHAANSQYIEQLLQSKFQLKTSTPSQKRFNGLPEDGLNANNESLPESEIKEKPPERKLPWILDIFLYPTSMSGLVNLGIFWVLPILLGLIQFLPIPFIGLIAILIRLIVAGYMYYFIMECVRDSATGGIRAPENIGSTPDMGEVITQVKEIVASVVIFWGPLGAYLMYRYWHTMESGISYDLKADVFYWLLLGYGIFFFPMGLLALVMFGSTAAFNPFLWITSILSTFVQYCCLVVFFCAFGWLVSTAISFFQSLFFIYLFRGAFIYLAMVAAHLLGRFYYLNSEKLKWEV